MKTATIIATALIIGGLASAPRHARADGEPPRLDDAHPPGALWYDALPRRIMAMRSYGLYPIRRHAVGYDLYGRPVRGYRH